jgi:outer membrane protein
MRGVWTYLWAIVGVAVAIAGMGSWQAAADTLEWAIVQAYQNNRSLNAQRSALHATDENVPQALSGYRPKLNLSVNGRQVRSPRKPITGG